MTYSNTVGSLRQQLTSSKSREIVFGTLLGDGFLQPMKNGTVRLEVGHNPSQKEFFSRNSNTLDTVWLSFVYFQ